MPPRPSLPANQLSTGYLPDAMSQDSVGRVAPHGLELPATLTALGGLGGAVLARNTGSPLRDALRGGGKGMATAAGGYLASQAVPEHPLLAGAAGGLGSWLAVDRLLDWVGANGNKEDKDDPEDKDDKEDRPKKADGPPPTPASAPEGEPAEGQDPLRDRALSRLLEAKAYSDRGDYQAKAQIMRQLLRDRPGEFVIDSEQGPIVGLTHLPTRFRMHLPRRTLPGPLARQAAPSPVSRPANLGTPVPVRPAVTKSAHVPRQRLHPRVVPLYQLAKLAGLASLAGKGVGLAGRAALRTMKAVARPTANAGNLAINAGLGAAVPGYAPARLAAAALPGAAKAVGGFAGRVLSHPAGMVGAGLGGLAGIGGLLRSHPEIKSDPLGSAATAAQGLGSALAGAAPSLDQLGHGAREHYRTLGYPLGLTQSPEWMDSPAAHGIQEAVGNVGDAAGEMTSGLAGSPAMKAVNRRLGVQIPPPPGASPGQEAALPPAAKQGSAQEPLSPAQRAGWLLSHARSS